jgi:aspartate carbamoyltransferase catalytic subunit
MKLRRKDLVGIADLSPEEIQLILDTASSLKEISARPIKKVPTLRGRTVVTLFYEPSTRTRMSFEIAAKRLSADTVNLTVSASSAVKGETLADTAHNLEAMQPDILVIRHQASGAPHYLAQKLQMRGHQRRGRPPRAPHPGFPGHAHRAEAKGSLEA